MTARLTMPLQWSKISNAAFEQMLVDVDVPELARDDAPIVAEIRLPDWSQSYRLHDDRLWAPLLPGQVCRPSDLNMLRGRLLASSFSSKYGLGEDGERLLRGIRERSGLISNAHMTGYSPYKGQWIEKDWAEIENAECTELARSMDQRLLLVDDEVWVRCTGPIVQPAFGQHWKLKEFEFVDRRLTANSVHGNAMMVSAFDRDALESLRELLPAGATVMNAKEVSVECDDVARTLAGETIHESAEWAVWSFLWGQRLDRLSMSCAAEAIVMARDALSARWGDEVNFSASQVHHVGRHLPGRFLPDSTDLLPVLEAIEGIADALPLVVATAARLNAGRIRAWTEGRNDELEDLVAFQR